jgi:hypothetical protein
MYLYRGYAGIKQYKGATIHVPKPDENISRSKPQKHSRRATYEPAGPGHFKQDYRLCRNYLHGVFGVICNVILAAAAGPI